MNILVIGASGYLGGMLYEQCSLIKNIWVHGTYCSKSSNKQIHKLDVMDKENVQDIIDIINPDIVVWSIMNENDELRMSEIGLVNVFSAISEKVRFIYISTLVSSKSNQNEDVLTETLSPEMYHANYVNGKIRGEELVKTHKNHVIIRPGQIFGFGVDGQPDARMKRILKINNSGEKYPRTSNSYISAVHIEDLVNCIIELFFSDFIGIINIAAEQPCSYYNFYKLLAKMLDINDDIIVPDFAETPVNSFFDTTKCKDVLSTHIRNITVM